MHDLAETLRIVAILIYPYMHTTTEKIMERLGWTGGIVWEDAYVFDKTAGLRVTQGPALFPRIDIEKELAELKAIEEQNMAAAKEKAGKEPGSDKEDKKEKAGSATGGAGRSGRGAEGSSDGAKPEITIDDFDKIDLRVGTILEASKHPDADRLLVFKVKIGDETRQIVSGVAQYFKPEEMVGKKVVVLANLKPRKIRGVESKGMILYAENGERLETVETLAEDGNAIS